MWLLFKSKCLDLMDRHIPTKLAKVCNGLPWVNQNLKQATRCGNRVWSKWKKSNSQTAHSHYLSLKKYVQRSFCVAYWNYINDLISPHNEDGKHQGQKQFLCTNFAAHLPKVTGIWHYPQWLAQCKSNPPIQKGWVLQTCKLQACVPNKHL